MADAAAGVVIEEVIRGITPLVKRHFQYLCCFNSNILCLEEEDTKLKDEEAALRRQVSEEENNARVIIPAVWTWLRNTKDWQDEMTKIQDGLTPNVRRGCLNIGSRYSFSRKAKKTSIAVQKHRNERPSLDSIAHDAPPACVEPIPQSATHEFQSRKQIEDEILCSLRLAGDNSIFGIGGMGGLGKTTMAESIKHKMKTEKWVDEVVMVVVSQPVDMLRIQLGMGEQLGLEDIKCLETVEARAQKLHKRLIGTKRILIILDDIWEVLDLHKLGIPSTKDSGNCIVLLTSRNEDLLNDMNAKVFSMKILSDEEAMALFKYKAGIHEDDQHLMSKAYDVVEECKGLPLALVTLGIALKDKDHRIWEDALDGLKGNNPAMLKPFLEQVYKPLRVSYDLLKEPEAELLFLLCSLFPEDFDISFETLTYYGMGLNMFNGVGSVHQARNRVCARVAMLKSRSLLLDSEYADHVKMHDVIRDVAIYIASEKGLDHEWISVFPNLGNVTLDHLVGDNFPKLQLMIIDLGYQTMETNEFSVMEGKGSLKVLSMNGFPFIRMPWTIELPKNLQTLHLINCALSSISMVGKLSNLEILICDFCDWIKELPIEVSNLTQLKLLHLTRCNNLKRIVPGVLSKLIKLEELNLSGSFTGWESTKVNSGERMNASLKELESLTKLINLNIETSNSNLVEEEIHLPTSPQKYGISFGQRSYFGRETDKYVSFKGSTIASWVLKLARRAEGLSLYESGPEIFRHLFESADQNVLLPNIRKIYINKSMGLHNVFLLERATEVISRLESLEIEACEKIEELLCIAENREDGRRCVIQFQNLKKLKLMDLPSLTTFGKCIESIEFPMLDCLEIYTPKLKSLVSIDEHNHDGLSCHCLFNNQVKFDKLRELWIYGCDNIKGLFSFSIANSLVTLTTLRIRCCKDMESVIVDENEMHGNFVEMKNESKKDGGTIGYHNTFPKLVELKLIQLPSLMTFSTSEIEHIDLPSLERLDVTSCPKFKCMVTSSKSEDGHNLHDGGDNESLHLFCNKKIKFRRLRNLSIAQNAQVNNVWCQHISPCFFKTLEFLNIWGFDNIRGLFSFSIVDSLTNLTRLLIHYCKDMERVIVDEKEMQGNFVEMKNASKKDGETIGHHITFPKLVELELVCLPSLMTFSTSGIERIDFPSLEKLEVRGCQKFKYMITSLKSENGLNLHDGGDHESLHLFCNIKVKFNRLKSLKLVGFDDSVSNIFCEQCPLDIFKSLEDLRIACCNSMMNLFSTSLVQELGNLQSLSIYGCEQMEKVIVDEKGKHKNFPLAFPNLKNLNLQYLPSLRCAFDCTLQLPLLEKLEIESCPGMEFLTCNSLSTPKLKSVSVDNTYHDFEDFGEKMDLNAFVRQHITSKEKGSTSDETEDEHEPAGNENEGDDLEVQPTLDDNVALDAAILDGSDALDSTIMTVEETLIENLEVDKRLHTTRKRPKSW